MAETLGTFAQAVPNATTLTALYTVPALTSFVGRVLVSTVTAASIRIAIAVAGAADAAKQYITYNEAVAANSSAGYQGLALGAGDVIRVYSSQADTAFTVLGVQRT